MRFLGATQTLLRFGPYELNLATEELRKHNLALKLSPQPFRILALLAGRSGQIVTRDEIRQQVWGEDTYVDFEHGMNQCIKQIRTVLCDDPDKPTYVETVPRKGYRFLALVTTKTVPAPLAVVESGSGISEALPALTMPAPPATSPSASSKPNAATPAAAAVSPAPAIDSGQTVAATPVAEPATAATTVASPPPPLPTPARSGRLRIAITSSLLVAVIAGFVYWHSRNASALTEKQMLVLADFQNTTGDPVFNDTLRQALAIQLEQSQFLSVLSDRKMSDTLKLMSRAANTPITRDVASDICQRNGYRIVLGGSIAPIGNHYLITLQATDCQNGENIASAEAEAVNRDDVIRVLGELSNQLQKKLGESKSAVEARSMPLERATTASMDALQAYTKSQKLLADPHSAIPYLKRAVELDPNFARAYVSLGSNYANLGDTVAANENFKKAYELRGRVSPWEQLQIEGHYYTYVTGQVEEAIRSYLQLVQMDPADPDPHAILAVPLYIELGRYQDAAAEMQERARLSGHLDYNLIGVYACLNRFDEAKSLLDSASGDVKYEFLRELKYAIAFLRGDAAAMQEAVTAAMGTPGAEDRMLSAQSDTEAYYGRLAKARDLSQAAVRSAKRTEAAEVAANWQANEALREAELGNRELASQRAAEALALSSEPDIEVKVAVALARSGDTAQAASLADKLDHQFPQDTMMQSYWLPVIKAAIELQKPNSGASIEILKSAAQYELGSPFVGAPGIASFGSLYPAYVRGLAYLQAGQGRQAAAEFQKLVDHRGILGNFLLGSLAHLQLARAQLMAGDSAAAGKSYQRFLTLWQDADPDLPIYKEAKAEYAKLH